MPPAADSGGYSATDRDACSAENENGHSVDELLQDVLVSQPNLSPQSGRRSESNTVRRPGISGMIDGPVRSAVRLRRAQGTAAVDPIGSALVRLARSSGRDASSTRVDSTDNDSSVPEAPAPASETRVSQPESSTEERRRFRRQSGSCLVTVVPTGEDDGIGEQELVWLVHSSPYRGLMSDVSIEAVAYLSERPLEPDSAVCIRMSNRRIGTNLDATGRILRCTRTEGGTYRIVCCFDYPLNDDQLSTLSRQLPTCFE